MRPELSALAIEDRSLVRSIPMFARLPEAIFEHLTASASLLRLPARATVFEEGTVANDLYLVLGGWLKLYRIMPTGEEAIIAMFSRGQSIAEAVALIGQPYPASAEAVTDCRVLRIPTQQIIAALRAQPDIAIAMLASISGHLHRLVGEITRLKAQNGLARVIEFLVDVDQGREAAEIALPFEKHVLARHLGMQPESFSRTLRRLKSHGVEVDGRRVAIQSWEALRKLSARSDG